MKESQRIVAIKEINYFTPQEKISVNTEISLMLEAYNIVRKASLKSSSPYLHIVEPLGFFVHA